MQTHALPNGRDRDTVRATFDLERQLHRELRLWCLTTADNASLAGVLRALARRLLSDDQLAADVAAELTGRPVPTT